MLHKSIAGWILQTNTHTVTQTHTATYRYTEKDEKHVVLRGVLSLLAIGTQLCNR